MQVQFNYTNGWQQSSIYAPQNWYDPSRWAFIECDIKVDAANSSLFTNGTYGVVAFNFRDSGWADHMTTVQTVPASATNWTHFSWPIPVVIQSPRVEIRAGQGYVGGPIRMFIDNIVFTSPISRPPIKALVKNNDSGGVRVSANGPGNPHNREALCQPAGWSATNNMFWKGLTPATYSMTITNWPSPTNAPNFQAHLYVVNRDSDPSLDWDETYGACDWNAADMIALMIQNQTNLVTPGLVVSLQWKTNHPSGPLDNIWAVQLPLASANGTWTLHFTSDTAGSIIAPDNSVVTNFTMPDFSSGAPDYHANFEPTASYVQFGLYKGNGDADNGSNNYKSFILTQVLVTNYNGVYFDDTFTGSMTNKYAWRVTDSQYVTYTPYNTAYWLVWSIPDSGFTRETAANPAGPWTDAGITYVRTDQTGTNRFGAVPASSVPPGPNAFWRLMKP
jgi:hypothetical protein